MREHDKETVVVIGAGLAGLTAAATAARARRPVVVVEAHTAGGRARTDELSGYRFNQGPHALGRGGQITSIWVRLNPDKTAALKDPPPIV
jgi:phytoene dehydrogenase-like protein